MKKQIKIAVVEGRWPNRHMRKRFDIIVWSENVVMTILADGYYVKRADWAIVDGVHILATPSLKQWLIKHEDDLYRECDLPQSEPTDHFVFANCMYGYNLAWLVEHTKTLLESHGQDVSVVDLRRKRR